MALASQDVRSEASAYGAARARSRCAGAQRPQHTLAAAVRLRRLRSLSLDNLAVIPLLHGHCHGLGGCRAGCATVARRLASDAAVRSSSSRGEERGACTEREYGGLRQSTPV